MSDPEQTPIEKKYFSEVDTTRVDAFAETQRQSEYFSQETKNQPDLDEAYKLWRSRSLLLSQQSSNRLQCDLKPELLTQWAQMAKKPFIPNTPSTPDLSDDIKGIANQALQIVTKRLEELAPKIKTSSTDRKQFNLWFARRELLERGGINDFREDVLISWANS